MQGERIINTGHFFEMHCVWYLETFHAIGVSPLRKVQLEGSSPPIRIIPANLALVLHAKSMQLVEPIRNRLPIPAQRHVLWVVVDWLRFVFTLRINFILFIFVNIIFYFRIADVVRAGLLFQDLVFRVMNHISQQLSPLQHSELKFGDVLFIDFFILLRVFLLCCYCCLCFIVLFCLLNHDLFS